MPEGQLQVNDRLTLVDPTPEHGYLEVQTSSGIEGWVFSRYIKVLASPSSSEPNISPKPRILRERNATILCGSTFTSRID